MVKEIEELRLKESTAVEEQKKLSRSVRYKIMMMTMTMTMTMMIRHRRMQAELVSVCCSMLFPLNAHRSCWDSSLSSLSS